MKDPHDIIIAPHVTEKSVALSYGDEQSAQRRLANEARATTKASGKSAGAPRVTEEDLVRKYTFIVAKDANKIEIKRAIETIYNAGKKKKDEMIEVTKVHTVTIKGKQQRNRRRWGPGGYTPDRKKAVITLAKGQLLEDYGV